MLYLSYSIFSVILITHVTFIMGSGYGFGLSGSGHMFCYWGRSLTYTLTKPNNNAPRRGPRREGRPKGDPRLPLGMEIIFH